MELAAIVGSAATVVQLVDFAGTLLKSTVTFIHSVTDAPKELEALHSKVRLLGGLFENIRLVAINHGLDASSHSSFHILEIGLINCAKDLQNMKETLPKEIEKGKTGKFVRFKRSTTFVVDGERLRALERRLDGHVTFLGALIGSISL
jgi:hypothetical protein